MAITELTQFQYDTLNNAANGPTRVVVILAAGPQDSPEKTTLHNQQQREMGELIHIGLVIDVSDQFTESINTSKINNNREFAVFAISDLGMKMFEEFEKRVVN